MPSHNSLINNMVIVDLMLNGIGWKGLEGIKKNSYCNRPERSNLGQKFFRNVSRVIQPSLTLKGAADGQHCGSITLQYDRQETVAVSLPQSAGAAWEVPVQE